MSPYYVEQNDYVVISYKPNIRFIILKCSKLNYPRRFDGLRENYIKAHFF